MTTEIFVAICMGLIVVEIGLILGAIVFLVMRLKKTAEAFEVLAYRLDDGVSSFSSTMRSSWFKAIQGAAGLVGSFVSSRREN